MDPVAQDSKRDESQFDVIDEFIEGPRASTTTNLTLSKTLFSDAPGCATFSTVLLQAPTADDDNTTDDDSLGLTDDIDISEHDDLQTLCGGERCYCRGVSRGGCQQ